MKILLVGVGGVGCEFLINFKEYSESLKEKESFEFVLVDEDVIEETNLHRQRLFSIKDIGLSKVSVAAKRCQLEALPIHGKVEDLTDLNFFAQFDCFVLAVDNLETRRWMNSTAFQAKRSSSRGAWFILDLGVQGFKCSIRSYHAGSTGLACLECTMGLFFNDTEEATAPIPICSVYGKPRDLKDCVFWALNSRRSEKKNYDSDLDSLEFLYKRVQERADAFCIDKADLSYKYITDLMERAVPAVASVNSILASEALRIFSELGGGKSGKFERENNFWMLNLEAGCYEMTTLLEANPDCIICGCI